MTSEPSGLTNDACDDGFSLVDVLVALVLLGLITGLIASFIGQYPLLARRTAQSGSQQELAAIEAYLTQAIAGAQALPLLTVPSDQRRYFRGGDAELTFVGTFRQGAQSFGLRETRLGQRPDGDHTSLVQDFWPRRLVEDQRNAALTSVEIADRVSKLRFRYLDVKASGSSGWMDKWDTPDRLPSAVEFSFEIERGGTIYAASRMVRLLSAP